MISIRCSILENVRQNPAAHGQLLASGDGIKRGGTHGVFAYAQDFAKLVHLGELTVAEAVKLLHAKFLTFDTWRHDVKKQEKFTKQFVRYLRQYDKRNFKFVEGWHLMKWDILSDARLTGRTPWVVSNKDGYFSYILTENRFEWEAELRFPLLQQYLAENTIECELAKLNIGIYSFETGEFEFLNYSEAEIKKVLKETGEVFQKVYNIYNSRKK